MLPTVMLLVVLDGGGVPKTMALEVVMVDTIGTGTTVAVEMGPDPVPSGVEI